MGMLSDWILTRLCGEFTTDPSAGSSSGLFSLAQRTWSDRVLDLIGLPREVVPPVREPGQRGRSGHCTGGRGDGARAGDAGRVGGADTQLGLIGIGVTEPNRSTVVGGTLLAGHRDARSALIDPQRRLRTLCHSAPGQWMLEGIGFYSGFAIRWFRDAFCDVERERGRRVRASSYVLMEEAAVSGPAGRERGRRAVLERDGREALGAGGAGVPRLRHRRSVRQRQEGVHPGDRGARGLRRLGH